MLSVVAFVRAYACSRASQQEGIPLNQEMLMRIIDAFRGWSMLDQVKLYREQLEAMQQQNLKDQEAAWYNFTYHHEPQTTTY